MNPNAVLRRCLRSVHDNSGDSLSQVRTIRRMCRCSARSRNLRPSIPNTEGIARADEIGQQNSVAAEIGEYPAVYISADQPTDRNDQRAHERHVHLEPILRINQKTKTRDSFSDGIEQEQQHHAGAGDSKPATDTVDRVDERNTDRPQPTRNCYGQSDEIEQYRDVAFGTSCAHVRYRDVNVALLLLFLYQARENPVCVALIVTD